MRVADILKGKGAAVMTVKPSETIGALAQRLRTAGVGAMVVSQDGHSLDGIVSERDVTYALPVNAGKLHNLPVSDIMTATVITCSPQDSDCRGRQGDDDAPHPASSRQGKRPACWNGQHRRRAETPAL